jgi:hypothetical protein
MEVMEIRYFYSLTSPEASVDVRSKDHSKNEMMMGRRTGRTQSPAVPPT